MSRLDYVIVKDPLVETLFEVARDDVHWCRAQRGREATRTVVSLGDGLTAAHVVNVARYISMELNSSSTYVHVTVRAGRLLSFASVLAKFQEQLLQRHWHAIVGNEPLEGVDQWYVQCVYELSDRRGRMCTRNMLFIEPESSTFEVRRGDRCCPIVCTAAAGYSVVLHV
jgi:hypothetical protein